jgi:hypothetical protein
MWHADIDAVNGSTLFSLRYDISVICTTVVFLGYKEGNVWNHSVEK